MDALEAMRTRRSLAQLREEPVPREIIEQLLEVATWAPNHKRAEPWRFAVFSGDAREKLAQAFRENYRLDHPDATPEELSGPGEKSAKRVLGAPVTIVVWSQSDDNEVQTLENYAATAVAVEHILLAAHALGLGAFWRTGEAAYTAPRNAIKQLVGAAPESQLTAFIPLGYPAITERESRRAPFTDKTQWFS